MGSASGGLAVLFNSKRSYLWISFFFLKADTDVIVSIVYIKPNDDFKVALEMLQCAVDEVARAFPQVPIIVGGDFNARVGTIQEDLSDVFTGTLLHAEHSSVDKVIN